MAVVVIAGLTFGCTHSPSIERPKGVELLVQGHQAMARGDKEKAIESLQAALQVNPNLITPKAMLGEIYRSDGKYDLASQQYEKLVVEDPYWQPNHYFLGLCYQFLDRLFEAAASYRNA